MKKFTLVIGIMLLSGVFASAQEKSHFSGGFYAGVNGTQIDGDAFYGYYHGGLNLAATAQYPLSNNLFLSLDLGFSQKGAQDKFSEYTGNIYKININYIDLPLLLHYYDRKKWGLYAGLEFSRLVGSPHQVINNYNNIYPASNYTGIEYVNNNDYEYVVGLTYYFSPKLSFDIRFCYSIVASGASQESLYRNFGVYNNLFQFRLGYIFGQEFEKDRSEKWFKKVKIE